MNHLMTRQIAVWFSLLSSFTVVENEDRTATITVTKENPQSHPPSVKDVGVEHFLSGLRTDNTNEAPANVIRENLLRAPESVKSALPADHNMKKLINDYRKKKRGCPASTATCTADVQIPLSNRDDSDGGLFVLADVTTPTGKRIVVFS